MDELLNPVDATCAGIRRLMLAEGERELSSAEAERVEEHVAACSACQNVLSGEDGMAALDPHHRSAPVEYPGEAEWAALGERIQEQVGLSKTGALTGLQMWWKAWVPLAAMLLISVLLIHNITRNGGHAPLSDFEDSVEVSEVPEGMESLILEDEEGVIIITMLVDETVEEENR